jgi:succinate-acetate transporter protein
MCKAKHASDRSQRLIINSGAYFGIGGLLLVLGGIGEWILGKSPHRQWTTFRLTFASTGNTFPSTIFFTFGGFWLAFGTTIIPGSGAYSTYSTTGTAADGLTEPSFYSTFAFFLIAMAILCAIYSVASIRTNIALFVILVLLVPCCE